MATIVQQTFNSVSKEGLSLGHEEWVRPMLFGNAWTKLRIGMLFAITDAPGGIASANLALGVCSGPVGFGSASTTHAVVYTPNNATTGTNYTYNAGAGYPYYNQGVVSHFTERVNGSNTSVITTAGQPCLYSLGGTLRMGLLGVDFAKIGGNVWTISLISWTRQSHIIIVTVRA